MLADEPILYPGLNVKWYSHAVENPSLLGGLSANGCGIQPPAPPKPRPAPSCHDAANVADRFLEVTLAGAADLDVDGLAPEACFFTATVHYPDEGEEAVASRKLEPAQATRSARSSVNVDCLLEGRIRVPFNSRQQFLKVGVYRRSAHRDVLVGEATVPFADPMAGQVGEWSLLRDFEDVGCISLSVSEPLAVPRAPSEEESASAAATAAPRPTWSLRGGSTRPSSTATARSGADSPPLPPLGTVCDDTPVPAASAGEEVAAGGAAEAAEAQAEAGVPPAAPFAVGDPVQVWSRSAGRWESGAIIEARGDAVTVEYGAPRRRRDLNVADANLGDHLRRPAAPPRTSASPADERTPGAAAPPRTSAPPAPVSGMKIGCSVEVLVDFPSDTDPPVMLKRGLGGLVEELDNDGDAYIKFFSLNEKQWVFEKNFDKLRVLPEAGTASAPAPLAAPLLRVGATAPTLGLLGVGAPPAHAVGGGLRPPAVLGPAAAPQALAAAPGGLQPWGYRGGPPAFGARAAPAAYGAVAAPVVVHRVGVAYH